MIAKPSENSHSSHLPTLQELGHDLLSVTRLRRMTTITLPFVAMGSYAAFANLGWWCPAVISVMVLCFITYGSSSHDLVHHTLGLSRRWNNFLLSLIELLSLRSGTAYRLSHLHHHQHLLESDDIEGSTAHGSFFRAIASGPTMQVRLWLWAWSKHKVERHELLFEAIGIGTILASTLVSARWTIIPLVYSCLVIAGSWVFPLVTVYFPHVADGQTPLTKTRYFRGRWSRLIAFDHLYHLEHHLYPAVPHHHWKQLADRLDPYFERAGVKPYAAAIIRNEPAIEQLMVSSDETSR